MNPLTPAYKRCAAPKTSTLEGTKRPYRTQLKGKVKPIRLYTSGSPRRRARKNAFTFNDVALRL